jgi:hypothetical protein
LELIRTCEGSLSADSTPDSTQDGDFTGINARLRVYSYCWKQLEASWKSLMEVSKGEISKEASSSEKNRSVAKSTFSLCHKAHEYCQMCAALPLLEKDKDMLSIVEGYLWKTVDIREEVKRQNATTGDASAEIAKPAANEDVNGIDPMNAIRQASERLEQMTGMLDSLIVLKKPFIDVLNQVQARQ